MSIDKPDRARPKPEWGYIATYDVSTGYGAVKIDFYQSKSGELGLSPYKENHQPAIQSAGDIANINEAQLFEVLAAIAQVRLKGELSEAQVKSNVTGAAIRKRNPGLVRIIRASVI